MLISTIWFSDDRCFIHLDNDCVAPTIMPSQLPRAFGLVGIWQIDYSLLVSIYKDFDNAYIIWSYNGCTRVGSFALRGGILHWSYWLLSYIIDSCPLNYKKK